MTPARLGQQSWQPTTLDHVCLAWLRAEWDKWHLPQVLRWLISTADAANPTENRVRHDLLEVCRGGLLAHVPPATDWYEVRNLEDEHLGELRVIGRCGWDDAGDANELAAVARRESAVLRSSPRTWDPLVLWGHTREGPFTILEGNNRLVAYANSKPRPGLGFPVYVGLSAGNCYWHLLDPPQ